MRPGLFVAQQGQSGLPPATLATGINLTTDLEFFSVAGTYELYYTTYAAGGQLRKVTGPPPTTIADTEFTALAPVRVRDTRSGPGTVGKLAGNSLDDRPPRRRSLPSDAVAVALNVTATDADEPGLRDRVAHWRGAADDLEPQRFHHR